MNERPALPNQPVHDEAKLVERIHDIAAYIHTLAETESKIKPFIFVDGYRIEDMGDHELVTEIHGMIMLRVSTDNKDEMLKQLGSQIAQIDHYFHTMFFCAEAWTTFYPGGNGEGSLKATQQPERSENIIIAAATIDDRHMMARMSVSRDKHNKLIIGPPQIDTATTTAKMENNLASHFWYGYGKAMQELIARRKALRYN